MSDYTPRLGDEVETLSCGTGYVTVLEADGRVLITIPGVSVPLLCSPDNLTFVKHHRAPHGYRGEY